MSASRHDPTADQNARHRFQTEIDRNFSVIASAGAGKTTAIVNRIVTIAEQDLARLPSLVVVTYTNSAARSFKRRARDLLLTRVGGHPREILSALEQTFFGTIHGFCVRLLREYQTAAGLPDNLTKITDRTRVTLWESFVVGDDIDRRLRSMPVARILLRFCPLPELLALAQAAEPVELEIDSEPPLLDLNPIRDCVVRSDIREKQQKVIGLLQQFQERAKQGTGYLGLPVLPTGEGKLKAATALTLDPLVNWIERAALQVAGALASDFKKLCVKQGLLSFNDQINLCRDLMKNPHVVNDVRTRQLSVILDEAQDTQGAMFRTLLETVRPEDASFGSWPGAGPAPRPGAFSLVGDPRQTIYEERSGLEAYSAINAEFRSGNGGELLQMSVTWRCAASVVNAVNHLFSKLEDPATQVPYDDLSAAPDAVEGVAGHLVIDALLPDPAGPVQGEIVVSDASAEGDDEITRGDSVDSERGVRARFRNECRQIARWLAAEGPQGLGLTSWSQLAILGQTHQWLALCGEELEGQGIPVSFYKQKIPFADQPGFAWPVALLYSSLKKWDQFERLGVLRDIFCVSDVELALWVRNGSSTDSELLGALALIKKFEASILSERSLSTIVQELLSESRLIERLTALGENLEPLEEFLRRVYEAESLGKSVSTLVTELLEALEEEAELPSASGDHVELITCHSAKGLEWDVVIPVGVDRESKAGRNDPYPQLIETGSGQQIIWNKRSGRRSLIVHRERAREEQLRRLFYVTLTRAKKGLVIPFVNGFYRTNNGSFASLLPQQPDSLAPVRLPLLSFEPVPPPAPVQMFVSRRVEIDRSILRTPVLIRPHALAGDDERVETFQSAESEAGSYDYGRWWHGWIEGFPWTGSELEQYGYTQTLGALPAFEERAVREIALLRESSDFRELLREGRKFQVEIPFSYPETANRWIEGVIDLVVIRRKGGLWIVDWKTNQHATSENDEAFADRLRRQYVPQLEAYRQVIEKGLKRSVTRLALYSTVLGRLV
jgi:ATP-dependent exoDNAse (exonuclease V) beta subunit